MSALGILYQHYGISEPRMGNGKIHCPFPDHDERTPSHSVNLNKGDGVWKCHSCPAEPSAGSVWEFIARMEEIPLEEAGRRATEILGGDFKGIRDSSDGSSGSSLLPKWARDKHNLNRPFPLGSRLNSSR